MPEDDPDDLEDLDDDWNPLGPPATAGDSMDDWDVTAGPGASRRGRRAERAAPQVFPDDSLAAQVVGVILGSPEFQRR